MAGEAQRAVEAVFRIERARLIAGLARMVRDVDRAEELAQDALVIALAEWPKRGVPENPGAWLMAAAKRRAIDGSGASGCASASTPRSPASATRTRHERRGSRGGHGRRSRRRAARPDLRRVSSGDVRRRARALTLRLIGGLTTEEIARAFLSNEPTVAQRIVRAKKAIAQAG
jgi:predicted RNA polymerase sigma factor